MALNMRRQERSGKGASGEGSSNFLQLENLKKYNFRFFSFTHNVQQEDFDRGLYRKGEAKIGQDDEVLDRCVWVHFTEGGVSNCAGRECDICDEAKSLKNSKNKTDQKAGKDISARARYYLNVVDMDNIEAGMQIVSLPSSAFKVVNDHILDPEYGEACLGCEGRDFIIKKDTNQEPTRMYSVKIRDAKNCVALDEELQESVTDLFKHDMLEAGWSSGGGNSSKPSSKSSKKDEDDDEDEKPSAASKSKAKPSNSKAKDDDDEDETEVPPKKGTSTKKKTEDEDEDLKDDDDDKDEKTSAASKSKAKPSKSAVELPQFVFVGAKVSFKNGSKTFEGVVTRDTLKDGKVEVETDDSFWDIEPDKLSPVKSKERRSA